LARAQRLRADGYDSRIVALRELSVARERSSVLAMRFDTQRAARAESAARAA